MKTMTRRESRVFTKEFKHQMVQLYFNGKPANEIAEEHDLSPTSVYTWVKQFKQSQLFKTKDNMTPKTKGNKEASCPDYRRKVKLIRANQHVYTINAMCRILQINRPGFYKYKEPEDKKDECIEYRLLQQNKFGVKYIFKCIIE